MIPASGLNSKPHDIFFVLAAWSRRSTPSKALATSDSLFLPTHEVNALVMGPAGYLVADFMRAGGIMTVLFLMVMMLTLIY